MKRLLIFGVLLAVLALALPATAQDEVTFTFGEFGNPESLYSMNTTEGISFRVLTQGCESLLKFEGDGIVPRLATS